MEYDIVILGGGVAGLTASLYCSRGGAKTILLEDSFIGGTTATLNNVENFPGIINMNGMEFVGNLYSQALSFGARIEIAETYKIDHINNCKAGACLPPQTTDKVQYSYRTCQNAQKLVFLKPSSERKVARDSVTEGACVTVLFC